MTPAEFTEWTKAIGDFLQRILPNRDSLWWSATFAISLAVVVATQMPEVLPAGWAPMILKGNDLLLKVAGGAAIVSAKMGWSWADSPKDTNERRGRE